MKTKFGHKRVALVSFVAAFVATTFASQVSARDVVMAYSGSLKDPAMICGIQTVAKELAEMVGGEVEMHVGGTGFASPKNLYTQLERGITDISVMPLAYTPGRFPLSEVVGLPFMAEDNLQATAVVNNLIPEFLADEYAGTHPLAVMAIPHYQLHLKDNVDDITTGLKGKRIRVTGATLSNTVRSLGADIVGVPIFQVYENMQKGVFDGFILPNVPLAAFKLHEVSDHHIQMNIGMPVMYMGVSNKFWESLTAEQQAMVTEKYTGAEAGQRYVNCFEKGDAGALKLALKDGSGTTRDITDEEKAAIVAAAEPVIEAYMKKLDDQGLAGRDFFAKFQAEIAKLGQ